jgi:hypothetical protein
MFIVFLFIVAVAALATVAIAGYRGLQSFGAALNRLFLPGNMEK